jgi:hypothetical protein
MYVCTLILINCILILSGPQALKASQLFQQSLVKRCEELKTKYMELKTRITHKTKKGGALVKGTRGIKYAGAKFSLAYELWVGLEVLDTPYRPDTNPLNPNRYKLPAAQNSAIMSELHESLSPELWELFTTPSRRAEFKTVVSPFYLLRLLSLIMLSKFDKSLKQERSTMVHTARSVAHTLLGIDQTHFSGHQRAKSPKLQSLLQNPNRPEEKYPLWASMLFPSPECNGSDALKVHTLRQVSPR